MCVTSQSQSDQSEGVKVTPLQQKPLQLRREKKQKEKGKKSPFSSINSHNLSEMKHKLPDGPVTMATIKSNS